MNALDTRELLREVDTVGKQSFFKTTWAPSQRDTLSFLFLNDPQTRSGSLDATVANSRDRTREQGGNNYSLTYNRIFSNILLEGAYSDHDAELTDIATTRTARNTVSFLSSTARTLAQEQLGGYGQDFPEYRPTKQFRASASYQWNQHRLKGGYEWAKREDLRGLIYIPESDRAQYTSISSTSGYGPIYGAEHRNGTVDDPAVQRQHRERLQRADQHHQRSVEPRVVLFAVRHERRRHDHRRPNWVPRSSSTAPRGTRTASTTTTGST